MAAEARKFTFARAAHDFRTAAKRRVTSVRRVVSAMVLPMITGGTAPLSRCASTCMPILAQQLPIILQYECSQPGRQHAMPQAVPALARRMLTQLSAALVPIEPQKGYPPGRARAVTHCISVNASRLVSKPPMRAPFPDSPTPPKGAIGSSVMV
jgi:hypothetical protein